MKLMIILDCHIAIVGLIFKLSRWEALFSIPYTNCYVFTVHVGCWNTKPKTAI